MTPACHTECTRRDRSATRSPVDTPQSAGLPSFPGPAVGGRRYDPAHHPHVLGGTMRRRTVIILLSAVVTALVVAGAVVWFNAESYEDKVADCKRAVAAYDFDAQPVEEGGTIPGCEDVKRDDYLALVLSNTITNMPEKDRDMLDYYDNGTIDGSIG